MVSLNTLCFLLASTTLAGDGQDQQQVTQQAHAWVDQAMLVNFTELLVLASPTCSQTDAVLPTSLRVRGRAGVGRLRQDVHTLQTCSGGVDEPVPLWRAGSFIRLSVANDLAVGFSGEVLAQFLNGWSGYVMLNPDSAFKIEDQTYYRELDLIYDGPELELVAADLSLTFDLYYAARTLAPLVVTMTTFLAIDTLATPAPEGSDVTQVLTVPVASQELTLDPLYLRRNLAGSRILRERPIIIRTLR